MPPRVLHMQAQMLQSLHTRQHIHEVSEVSGPAPESSNPPRRMRVWFRGASTPVELHRADVSETLGRDAGCERRQSGEVVQAKGVAGVQQVHRFDVHLPTRFKQSRTLQL